MVASSFDAALARVLVHEGGYSDHPADPGGPTMKGIIQRVYDAYRASGGASPRPVRLIEQHELITIYRRQYWDAVRADELPAGIDYVVFDGAVNSGPAQSLKWLQRALGVPADGAVGAVTLTAAAACADRAALVDRICDRRLAMLRSLGTFKVFGTGWTRRVADVRRAGRAWAHGTQADPLAQMPVLPAHAAPAGAKAPASSAAALPGAQAGAGAAAGGLMASAVAEAARQVAPLASGSATLSFVFTVLTLAGLVLTCAGIGAVWWAERARSRQAVALDLSAASGPGGRP
ncbi:glycosyl hydrolase 108 family protein [Xanthobacter sp. DSM 24535]|uniref:glycosyl hydrolase 108 family protein n=1 Tax=Roseixanthobacter psychrophilus TaxID=3119917 RepID=UPI003728C158